MNIKILLTFLVLLGPFSVAAQPLCETPNVDKASASFSNLVQGRDGWLFREHDLITRFGPGRIGYKGIKRLTEALATRGVQLVMVPIPTRGLVHPEYLGDVPFDRALAEENYASYLTNLRALGVMVPPLESVLTTKASQPLFFARDHHWTPEGSRKIAKATADFVKDTTDLSDLVDVKYQTIQEGAAQNPGSYGRAAKQLCDKEFQTEDFPVFGSVAQLDLFTEPSSPEIVLVGTSNSNGSMKFNFAGFLRTELGKDVLNLAKSGGGYDEAIQEYLASDLFRDQPPRVLIWEVPGYYSLNTASFYDNLMAQLEQ